MSSRSHKTNRHHVQFSDDRPASDDDFRNYVTKMETTMRTDGPHFPGLHSMFKHKTTHTFNEEIQRPVKQSEDEDIDAEASEYIQRKHHFLDLQKLNSMKMS